MDVHTLSVTRSGLSPGDPGARPATLGRTISVASLDTQWEYAWEYGLVSASRS
jgi:hypothetical protein